MCEIALFSCRDALIASVLDGVRASGNRDVCVKMTPTLRGYRLGECLFTLHPYRNLADLVVLFIIVPDIC